MDEQRAQGVMDEEQRQAFEAKIKELQREEGKEGSPLGQDGKGPQGEEARIPPQPPPPPAPPPRRLGPPGAKLIPPKRRGKKGGKTQGPQGIRDFMAFQKRLNDAFREDLRRLAAQVEELKASNRMQREVVLGQQVITDELARRVGITKTKRRALFQHGIEELGKAASL